MNPKKKEFFEFLESIEFTNIQDTSYTWKDLGRMFGINHNTLRGWSKHFLSSKRNNKNNNGTKKTLVKSWEMLSKDGIVTLHSYKHIVDIKEEIKEAISNVDFDSIVNKLNDIKNRNTNRHNENKRSSVLCIGDVHIGMDIKNSMFGFVWNMEELFKRMDTVIEDIKQRSFDGNITDLLIVFGGDIIDGQDNQTTRRRHELPQNMDNKQQLETAIEFIVQLCAYASHFVDVTVYYISNSNHGGIIEYAAGKVAKEMLKDIVKEFVISDSFITPTKYNNIQLLITHGYDEEMMSKGFSRFITEPQKAIVRKLAKANDMKYPVLARFDLHQYHDILYDDIRDILIPSFAPPSSYISYNFGADYSGGYVFIHDRNNITVELVNF